MRVAFLVVSIFACSSVAQAVTVNVTTLEDESNADGDCSLREALDSVNFGFASDACPAGDGTDDRIVLPAGTITLTLGRFDTFVAMEIEGAGAGTTIIDGGSATQIFFAQAPTTIRDLTLQNGANTVGAAIRVNAQPLLVEFITFADNAATAFGGALFVTGASNITVRNCLFDTNSAGNSGGAIRINAGGTLVVEDSRLAGNSAGTGGAASFFNASNGSFNRTTLIGNTATSNGGAVFADSTTVLIDSSTLTQNDAVQGGAIYSDATTVDVVNSTFSLNTALIGGALFEANLASLTRMSQSTITANTAGTDGGLSLLGLSEFRNNILAGNAGSPPDMNAGLVVSLGYNIVGDGTGITGFGVAGDQIGTAGTPLDPGISALADNGGATVTHALTAGSPAIDMGSCENFAGGTAQVDQRGEPRSLGATCDIGAVEYCADPDADGICSDGVSRAFVTSAVYGGDLGGLAGADSTCQRHADSANLGGSWTAWLSDSSTSAADRHGTVGAIDYVLVDRTIFADDYIELASGTLQNALSLNETGVVAGAGDAWTGTAADGSGTAENCADWTNGTTGAAGYVGAPLLTDATWTENQPGDCSSTAFLYCLETTIDPDNDNDGAPDVAEVAEGSNPDDPLECGDSDNDTCDDCINTGDFLDDAPDAAPDNDGADSESDGLCDVGDPDDDNDGVSDTDEATAGTNPNNHMECGDTDADTCDDCSVAGDLADDGPDADPNNDGTDTDSDGTCDVTDTDTDNDGVSNVDEAIAMTNPLDVMECGDSDADGCDDCAVTGDFLDDGPDADPNNDGSDLDADGFCDLTDVELLTTVTELAEGNAQCPYGGTLTESGLDDGIPAGTRGNNVLDNEEVDDAVFDCDAAPPDADGDGITDVDDNCPDDENVDQHDGDGDGEGDACDPDADGDGVEDTFVIGGGGGCSAGLAGSWLGVTAVFVLLRRQRRGRC